MKIAKAVTEARVWVGAGSGAGTGLWAGKARKSEMRWRVGGAGGNKQVYEKCVCITRPKHALSTHLQYVQVYRMCPL